AAGAASLSKLVGPQYDTLLAAGFHAEGLAGSSALSPAAVLHSHQGTARLVDAIVRVLQWLDGFAPAVVLFIDDWHRAPNEAAGFVHACSRRGDSNALTLVLATRSDGAAIYPDEARVLELKPFADSDRFELLTQLLGEPDKARAVIDWLGDHAN